MTLHIAGRLPWPPLVVSYRNHHVVVDSRFCRATQHELEALRDLVIEDVDVSDVVIIGHKLQITTKIASNGSRKCREARIKDLRIRTRHSVRLVDAQFESLRRAESLLKKNTAPLAQLA